MSRSIALITLLLAGAAPPERYVCRAGPCGSAPTPTVFDPFTGLTWQRELDPGTFTWQEAIVYCEGLDLDGRSDWRLPSKKELESLVDESVPTSPTIDGVAFPGTPGTGWGGTLDVTYFWTSSPVVGTPNSAWIVIFGNGKSFYQNVAFKFRVRCVR